MRVANICSHSTEMRSDGATSRTSRGTPSSITTIVWCGARRRSVGLPGLTIQRPPTARDLGQVRVAVGDERRIRGTRRAAARGGSARCPASCTSPIRSPSASTTSRSGQGLAQRPARPCCRGRRRTGPSAASSSSTESCREVARRGGSASASREEAQALGGQARAPRGRWVSPRSASTALRRVEEAPVAVDELAVRVDLAALAQIADDVPVQRRPVQAAALRIGRAEREVDGAADLLVEERVAA